MARFILPAIVALSLTNTSHACEPATAQQMRVIVRKIHAANPDSEMQSTQAARRRAIHEQIRQALEAHSPDLSAIAHLRREDESIALEQHRIERIAMERSLNALSYCEKIAFLRAAYPGPITTINGPVEPRSTSEPVTKNPKAPARPR